MHSVIMSWHTSRWPGQGQPGGDQRRVRCAGLGAGCCYTCHHGNPRRLTRHPSRLLSMHPSRPPPPPPSFILHTRYTLHESIRRQHLAAGGRLAALTGVSAYSRSAPSGLPRTKVAPPAHSDSIKSSVRAQRPARSLSSHNISQWHPTRPACAPHTPSKRPARASTTWWLAAALWGSASLLAWLTLLVATGRRLSSSGGGL